MAQSRIHHSIYSDLFPEPSKAEQRTIQIVEAAIKNYASIGVEKTTYDRIAKTCKISRPLIQHYFKDKDAIFEMAIKYIRATYQNYVTETMSGKTDALDILKTYIASALSWMDQYPEHSRTWFLFFYRCTFEKKLKTLNTSLVKIGHERIQGILKLGATQGHFKVNNVSNQAKLIQTLITGAIATEMTETLPVSKEAFHQQTIKNCLKIAQSP